MITSTSSNLLTFEPSGLAFFVPSFHKCNIQKAKCAVKIEFRLVLAKFGAILLFSGLRMWLSGLKVSTSKKVSWDFEMAPLIFLPRRTKTVNIWQGSGPTWPSLALLHPYIRIKIRGEESDNKKSRNSVSGGREWLTQESVQNDIKLSCWVVVTRCQGRFKTQFLFLKAWHLAITKLFQKLIQFEIKLSVQRLAKNIDGMNSLQW